MEPTRGSLANKGLKRRLHNSISLFQERHNIKPKPELSIYKRLFRTIRKLWTKTSLNVKENKY